MVDSLGFSLHRLDADAFQRFEGAFLAESLDDSNSRNLLSLSSAVRSFASSTVLRAFTGQGAFPVCARLFNKNPAANWLVPWHQDLTIRVRERRDVSGYGPWSIKDGVHHVQPPVGVLEGMLAIRIHLDRADSRNGGLRVLPGTHRFGRIPGDRIAELAESIPAVSCDADRGEALCMRPLLLHASSRSVEPRARRVIHISTRLANWTADSSGCRCRFSPPAVPAADRPAAPCAMGTSRPALRRRGTAPPRQHT